MNVTFRKLLAAGMIAGVAATMAVQEENRDSTIDLTPRREMLLRKAGEEIVSLRTKNSQVFKGENGKFVRRIYAGKKFYFDKDELKYKEYDFTKRGISALARLNPFRDHDEYIRIGNHAVTWFKDRPHDYKFIRDDGHYVKYTALFDTAGISIETRPMPEGVKQNIYLNDERAGTVLKWIIDTNADSIENNGEEIIFRSVDGKILFRTNNPVAWDKNGKSIVVNSTVSGDTLVYSVVLPADFEYPITVDPSTTITATNYTRLYSPRSTSYTTARDATSGTESAADLGVGQAYPIGGTDYLVYRTALMFDLTSTDPNMISIDSASLYLSGQSDKSTTDFDAFVIASNQQGSPSGDWFNDFYGWQTSGTYSPDTLSNAWNSVSYSDDWNEFVFNSTGLDSIESNWGDTLRVFLISGEDIVSSAPTDYEFVVFNGATYSPEPYLSITYTVPSINAPTDFLLTPISNDSMKVSWTGNTSNWDSLGLRNYSDDTTIAYLNKSANVDTVTGLNPYTKYVLYAHGDSSGITADSAPDSLWTAQELMAYNIYPIFTSSGHTYAQTAVYDSARTETDADSIGGGIQDLYVGQFKDASEYTILRANAQFAIPDSIFKIFYDTLYIDIYQDESITDFTIDIYSGLWNSTDVFDSRYYKFDGWQSDMSAYGGVNLIDSWNTSSAVVGINRLVFNAEGQDSIFNAIGDTLRISLLSHEDVNASAPADTEYVWILAATTSDDTFLKLIVAPPDSAPINFTVTTIDDDSILVDLTDRSHTEYGWVLRHYADDTDLNGDTLRTMPARVGGLDPNTLYSLYAYLVGGSLHGTITNPDSAYTEAAPLVNAPDTTYVSTSAIGVIIDTTGVGNPSDTEYSIMFISSTPDTAWADATAEPETLRVDLGLDDDWGWRTYDQWGPRSGTPSPVSLRDINTRSR